MLTLFNKILFILIFSFLSLSVFGQEAKFFNKLDSNQRQSITQNIFNEIEMGKAAKYCDNLIERIDEIKKYSGRYPSDLNDGSRSFC